MVTKLFPVVLCAVFLLGTPAYCNESEVEELFTRIKITLTTTNPPNFRNVSNANTSLSAGNLRNKWLIVSVDYVPTMPGRMRHFWIDDVSMEIHAIFTGQSGNEAVPIIFTGRTDFRTVAVDARKHTATMMIPPHLLDRYLPTTGAASTVSTSSTFNMQVQFMDRAGTVIGAGYYGSKTWTDKEYKEYFDKILRSKPLTVQNAILPRSLTPWAWIDVDNHDLLKPPVGGAVQAP